MSTIPDMSMLDATPTTASISSTGTRPSTATDYSEEQVTNIMAMDGCKVSMLWNWYSVNTCFLSSTWKVRSNGGFAGLCIGVIFMGIFLQGLGWVCKFYDKRLVRQHQLKAVAQATQAAHNAETNSSLFAKHAHNVSPMAAFRPNLMQQAVRTLLRSARFALAYWIMLIAVYYNGYMIICTIIGTFLGLYVFQWEKMGGPQGLTPGGSYADPIGLCG